MKSTSETALNTGVISNPVAGFAISVGFALVIALSARISFMTPFSPIPVTLQTAAVLLAGLLLGSRWGLISVLTYIVMGLVGAPVFAMGMSGPAIFISPSFGYILGFPFAAWLTGYMSERMARSMGNGVLIGLAGDAVIFATGMIWLAGYKMVDGQGLGSALQVSWAAGVLPFLLVDTFKIILAAGIWCIPGLRIGRKQP